MTWGGRGYLYELCLAPWVMYPQFHLPPSAPYQGPCRQVVLRINVLKVIETDSTMRFDFPQLPDYISTNVLPQNITCLAMAKVRIKSQAIPKITRSTSTIHAFSRPSHDPTILLCRTRSRL